MKFRNLLPLALLACAPALQAQDSPTTTTGLSYDIPVGTRLEYQSLGKMNATGPMKREQEAQFKSRLTVLDKRDEGYTVLAELDIAAADADSTSTDARKYEAAARFTFLLPPEGATPGQSFQTAGLSASPFPGWRVEDLFPQLVTESSTSMSLPIAALDDVLQVSRTVEKAGDETSVLTVAPSSATPETGGVQSYTEQLVYSNAEKTVKSTSTTLVAIMALPNGEKGELTLQTVTERTNASKLEQAQVNALKKDVETAIPLSVRIRSLQAQDPAAMTEAGRMLGEYLTQHPEGAFAPLYKSIHEKITSMASLQANSEKIKEGEKAPEFAGKTIDGKDIKLSDYAGKVVLLDFWATWCGPCVAEMPNVKALYEKNKSKGFEIIGLSADNELKDLQDFVKEQKISWPNIFEPDATTGTAMLTYGITKYPTTVLIDKKGVINKVDLRGEELDKAVDDLLKSN